MTHVRAAKHLRGMNTLLRSHTNLLPPLQCDLEANEGVLTAMVAANGGVQYFLHGGARGGPKLVSPTEPCGDDFGAWLDGRCALVRCAMPMQLRLYGIKVGSSGPLTTETDALPCPD